MRVLITGGAGFLGSHLSDAFIARGDEVFVLDTGAIAKVRHLLDNPRFHYVHDSVFNLELIDSLVSKADLIYHLAAVVGVEHYVGDPYETLNVNVNGTQNLLKAAYKHGRRLVFSSTSEVYGRNPKVPWKEDDDRVLGATTIDRWCYSTSKAVGEHFCFAYHKLGLPVTVVRYFNIYGPRLDRVDVGRLFTIFMGQLLRGADLTVIGDGKQTRCFTYVTDAVAATVAAGINPAADGQAINIGTDVETTVLEFANLMIELYRVGQIEDQVRQPGRCLRPELRGHPAPRAGQRPDAHAAGCDAEGHAARGHGALDGLVSARAGRLIPVRSA